VGEAGRGDGETRTYPARNMLAVVDVDLTRLRCVAIVTETVAILGQFAFLDEVENKVGVLWITGNSM